jgi:hypothetical protein
LTRENLSFPRIEDIKDEKDEVPADFDNEIHKWALECKDTARDISIYKFKIGA